MQFEIVGEMPLLESDHIVDARRTRIKDALQRDEHHGESATNGRPSVKLATTDQGGGPALVSDSQGTYVQLSGRGLVVTKDGRQQLVP